MSHTQLVVTGAVLATVFTLGRGVLTELRAESRLASCQSVAEGLRRQALSQLTELDQVTPLPLNPTELPADGVARLDPEIAGWRTLVQQWDGEVAGQFALHATSRGFLVEARCVATPGEAPVLLQADERSGVRAIEAVADNGR